MGSIFRKSASILLSGAMLLQSISLTALADKSSTLLVNESFNNYTTNEKPSSIDVTGNRSYVTEYAQKEKGYKLELGAMAQIMSWKVNLSGECFISFDMFADNKFSGKVAISEGTATKDIVSFDNGVLKSHNGKQISGVGNKKKNLTLHIDFDTASYSVYEDGKAIISDCYISSMKLKSADKVNIELSSKYAANVTLDNINIGLGKPLFKGYPVAPYNDACVERVEYVPVVNEEVFLKVNFEKGSKLSARYLAKENILEQGIDDEGNGCVKFERSTSSDFHLDIYTSAYSTDSIVYEHDVKLLSKDVSYTSYLIAANGNGGLYSIDSGILSVAGNKTSAELKVGKWHKISIVYNFYEGEYDVYLDYKLVRGDCPISATYSHAETQSWRIHANRTSGDDAFYIDNIAIYGGKEPRTIENQGFVISDKIALYESDDAYKTFLKDKISYHLRSGVLYANEEKEIVSPIVDNGITYVPLVFFEKAFGLQTAYDASNQKANIGDFEIKSNYSIASNADREIILSTEPKIINGEFSVPLKAFVTECLGKSVQYDNSTISGGFIIISDKEVDLSITPDLQKLNDFVLYLRPSKEKIASDYELSGKAGVHPRVMADSDDFARIRSLVTTDDNMRLWADKIIAQADTLCKSNSPLIYELTDGVRLLYVARDMVDHMFTLGMAYQLTDNKKYADRAWIDLESVAGFADWHPQHALDVGTMACGVAVGYDWMYDAFTPQQRIYIEEGALNCGISAYVDGYQKHNTYMSNGLSMTSNWGMVMNGGASMLGTAFYDAYPEYSAYLISSSIRCLEFAIYNYAPDGEWYEGMGYADMTLEYLTYQLASIKDIFGTAYTLDATEGLERIPGFYLYMQSPQGCFGYKDAADQTIHFDPGMLWIGDHYNDYATLNTYSDLFGFDSDVRTLLWYNPDKMAGNAELSLDKLYTNEQVLTMRDSWEKNEHTVFAGMKGFMMDLGHGHIDHGTFMFYSGGTQWTHDLGSEDYNVPGYWQSGAYDAPRWQYYRLRGEGHNTLIINPDEYAEFDPKKPASFVRLETKPKGVIGVIDTTEANMGKAKSAQRGIYFADNRQSLVVRDEIVTNGESTMYWFLHTEQNAKLTDDGKGVILTDKNNKLNYVNLDFVCNKNYTLTIGPSVPLETSPKPEVMTDDSATKVIVLKVVADGEVNITAKLTPCTTINAMSVAEFDMPMSQWSVPDGELIEKPVLDSLFVEGIQHDTSQKNIIHLTVGDNEEFAQIEAYSDKFDVEVIPPQSTNDIAIINVYSRIDRNFKTTYKVAYKILKPTGIPGTREYAIAKLEASAEPQSENNAMNLIDRDMTTRWSASGLQHIILDLGKSVELNTVYLAFMTGSERKYNVAIAVSDDGIKYEEVYSGASSGTTNDYEAFDIGERKARYIKISGNGWTGGSWNSWTEVAVSKR